jgi:hypothetical protein
VVGFGEECVGQGYAEEVGSYLGFGCRCRDGWVYVYDVNINNANPNHFLSLSFRYGISEKRAGI